MDRGRVIADGTSEAIKRRVPGRTVGFDLDGPMAVPDGPMAVLDGLPGVVGREVRGDRVQLHTTDSDATVLALAEAGMVRNLEVTGAGLEEAFLALTERKETERKETVR